MADQRDPLVLKSAQLAKSSTVDDGELAIINQYTLTPLEAGEVFTFRLAACDDQPDRDNECFALEALADMARLYPGKPVLLDHRWSSQVQTARIYKAAVEPHGEGHRLVLSCYVPRLPQLADTIRAIETGIIRECSVGVSMSSATCSICGKPYRECLHIAGESYGGRDCIRILGGCIDVYEVSLVAVPAQREAGVVKGASTPAQDVRAEDIEKGKRLRAAQMAQELEEIRYGGT